MAETHSSATTPGETPCCCWVNLRELKRWAYGGNAFWPAARAALAKAIVDLVVRAITSSSAKAEAFQQSTTVPGFTDLLAICDVNTCRNVNGLSALSCENSLQAVA